MKELNASPGKLISIGYEGEDKITKIVFRYDEDWLACGDGVFKIRVLRHGDTEAYNATEVVDNREEMTLTMTVTDIELSVKGHGEMQVVYIGADFVKKSPIYRYNVARAIDSEVVNPPQGSIINELLYDIGDLDELTTTNKNSLVEAINEVNAKEGGGGDSVTVDDELSGSSENPVQNKVIKSRFDGVDQTIADVQTAIAGKASTDVATQSANGLMSSADKAKLDNVGSVVTVSGTTPTITALSGVRYVCGEVATLDFTPSQTGICDVVFTSGATATVLTVPSTIKWANGFDPTALDANTTYEINIMDGLGVAVGWT